MDPVRIVATGGGTGGHVLPHFSVLDEHTLKTHHPLKDRTLDIYYIGSESGIERKLVQEQNPHWHYIPIKTGKLRRYASWRTLVEPFFIFMGFLQAWAFLFKNKPHVVFSKGGFVSAPVVWAAWLCRIPIVIHESDATPALTTRLTAPFAKAICLTFAESLGHFKKTLSSKCRVTGLPLRAELFQGDCEDAHAFFSFPDRAKPVLLVFGGSLGAQALNQGVSLHRMELLKHFHIIHITGHQKADGFTAPGYKQFPYLQGEMPLAYAIADLVVCRAGASSIFELAALRLPMILVPLGLGQSRGDQIINGQIFEKKNWAIVLPENKLNVLTQTVLETLSQKDKMIAALELAPGPYQGARDVQKTIIDHMRL